MNYYNNNIGCMGCILTIIVCILLGAFSGWVFMLLWNWVAPLFWKTAPTLTFWQAWGCMILLNMLTSGLRKSK